jgi:hypothetical protein
VRKQHFGNDHQPRPPLRVFFGKFMSSLSHSTVITVAGREVIVRELTVKAARALIQSDQDTDVIGSALLEDVRLLDLPLFTNLTLQEIDEMYPSDLRTVVEACKSINPDFFGMVARFIRPGANPSASSKTASAN